MGTFLTNPKMSVELRERIEASVRGHTSKKSPNRRRPNQVLVLRLGIAAAVACVVCFVAIGVAESRAELAQGRRDLVERVEKADGRLTATERALPAKVAAALLEASGPYPGDVVSETCRKAGLAAVLERPSVYLRFEQADLGRQRAINDMAADSGEDTLSRCLLSRPPGRDEKSLLQVVREAYRTTTAAPEDVRLFRLHDALAGLRVLNEDWRQRAQEVSSRAELRALDASLSPRILDQALRAARAEILIQVMDEAKSPGTITELDGATDHFIRLSIVDLQSEEVLVRHRARVGPSWVSEKVRSQYARGLCDCRFAYDLYEWLGEAAKGGGAQPG